MTQNRDFANGRELLSLEQSPNEVTWSSGSVLDASAVAKAFQLESKVADFPRADVAPFSAAGGQRLRNVLIVIVVVLILLALLGRCSSTCNPNVENCGSSSYGARSSGGSYGGYSGGGGHK